jgi:hypothetical protein
MCLGKTKKMTETLRTRAMKQILIEGKVSSWVLETNSGELWLGSRKTQGHLIRSIVLK